MNENAVKRAGDWLRLLGALPHAYSAVLLMLLFVAAGLGWLLSLPIQWVVLAIVLALGVSFGLGLYLGKRRAAAASSSLPQAVPLTSPSEPNRTAIRARGRASVELDNSPISRHDIAVDALDDSKVKLRDSPIK